MAAIIAGVVAAAGAGLSAYGQSQSAKAAKKGSKSSNTPTFTPQGQATQNQLLRLLFDRLGKPAQSYADFQKTGPQALMNTNAIPYSEQQTLGIRNTSMPEVLPPSVTPEMVAALQKLGIMPRDQTTFSRNTPPPAGQVLAPFPGPMSGPAMPRR